MLNQWSKLSALVAKDAWSRILFLSPRKSSVLPTATRGSLEVHVNIILWFPKSEPKKRPFAGCNLTSKINVIHKAGQPPG
eukprot:scaffold250272_cov42-Prasinocladus_malaysianus.AAC.1